MKTTLLWGFIISLALGVFSNNFDWIIFSGLVIGIIIAYFFMRKKSSHIDIERLREMKEDARTKPEIVGNNKDIVSKSKKINWSLDKAVKLSIVIGIILVAVALFYYFLVRPRQEEKAYTACLSALKDSGKFNEDTINTPIGKSALDVCTKSNGAERVVAETKQRAQDEISKREQERLALERKQLNNYEMFSILPINVKLNNYKGGFVPLGKRIYEISGTIRNNNNFDITKVSLKFILASNKLGNNKTGEVNCDLKDNGYAIGNDAIFYANSSKDFTQICTFPDKQYWYQFSIRYAEKNI